MRLRQPGNPRIPRRRMQLANVRVCGKRPNNSVLSPAPTNHKYAHASRAYP
jgi:hypothetical protein